MCVCMCVCVYVCICLCLRVHTRGGCTRYASRASESLSAILLPPPSTFQGGGMQYIFASAGMGYGFGTAGVRFWDSWGAVWEQVEVGEVGDCLSVGRRQSFEGRSTQGSDTVFLGITKAVPGKEIELLGKAVAFLGTDIAKLGRRKGSRYRCECRITQRLKIILLGKVAFLGTDVAMLGRRKRFLGTIARVVALNGWISFSYGYLLP
eukprot:3490573-Rhodomonas_salina.1